jgi:hypothetical protein
MTTKILVDRAFNTINAILPPSFQLVPLYRSTEQVQCPLFLHLSVDHHDIDKPAGKCVRKYGVDIYEFVRPYMSYYYYGCNITVNIHLLNRAASFYNVLLHELLHLIGLDHPNPPMLHALISHTVRRDNNKSIIHDNVYKQLSWYDIMTTHFIIARNFPWLWSKLPYPYVTKRYYYLPVSNMTL